MILIYGPKTSVSISEAAKFSHHCADALSKVSLKSWPHIQTQVCKVGRILNSLLALESYVPVYDSGVCTKRGLHTPVVWCYCSLFTMVVITRKYHIGGLICLLVAKLYKDFCWEKQIAPEQLSKNVISEPWIVVNKNLRNNSERNVLTTWRFNEKKTSTLSQRRGRAPQPSIS